MARIVLCVSRMTTPPTRILVAVDLDDTARATWNVAASMLQNPSAAISVVHVIRATEREVRGGSDDIAARVEHEHNRVQHLLTEALDGASAAQDRIDLYVVVGDPAAEILQLAVDLTADLIVVGTNDRSGLARIVIGSVASEIFRRAPCSVLVARSADYAGLEKTPTIDPPLAPGQSPMRSPTVIRYRSVPFSTYNANLFPTGIPRKQVR